MASRTSMSPAGASRSGSPPPPTSIGPVPRHDWVLGRASRAARPTLIAPMPGAVLTVHVRIGSQVQAGDPVVTLEAMKMEHVVVAPVDGRLTELRVQPADQVTRGQELGLIEP